MELKVAREPRRALVRAMFADAVLQARVHAAGFNIGVPFETHDLETRIKEFQRKGGVVNVCPPCLIHRGLQDVAVLDGIVRIKGTDLMEKKDLAMKLMQFT